MPMGIRKENIEEAQAMTTISWLINHQGRNFDSKLIYLEGLPKRFDQQQLLKDLQAYATAIGFDVDLEYAAAAFATATKGVLTVYNRVSTGMVIRLIKPVGFVWAAKIYD